VQTRIQRLSDLGPLTSFFFSGRLPMTPEMLRDGKLSNDQIRTAFQLALWQFDALPAWELAAIEAVLRGLDSKLKAKFRDIIRHFYIAITGTPTSVPLFNAMEILGRDICRERLRVALNLLGGVSIAEAGEWRKLLHVAEQPREDGAEGEENGRAGT
jgi:glutamyl-tRNA synthetase